MSDNNITHRLAKKTILFLDREGKPLANQKITVKQTGHEFLFGCGAFDTLAYVNMPEGEHKAMFEDRVKKWLEVYNYGTLPFYWGQFEREEGKPGTEGLLKAANFLRSKNVTVKGHPLCWHTVCADWLMKYDNETILKKQLDRINREVTQFAGVIDMWDVINEVVIMPNFDKYDNAVTRLCKWKGRFELVKEVFEAAKAANNNTTLLLNDFNTSVAYEILIEGCLDAGIPIDVIGIQSHQHQGYWGAEKVKDVLSRFSKFGLPIHFSENTLVSGTPIPSYIEDLNDWQVSEWPSTPEGEERQADQTEEMYRLLFENPLVKAVTGWDFADGAWLKAPSGVIHKDNSLKPVYHRLKKLIHEEWQTDTSVVTNENGVAAVEGFKGEYMLGTENGEAALSLHDDKEVTIKLS